MTEGTIIAIIGAGLTIITGVVGALWRQVQLQSQQLQQQNDRILLLTAENVQLKADIANVRDDLNVEREAHRIDNETHRMDKEKHERQMQNFVDENRILRSALRANGINVEDYSASETPPGVYGRNIRRKTEGERGE